MTTPLASLQDFLLRLTPWRAFRLFGVALGLSVILLYLNWGEPFLPSVPVALYGSVLYYCQARFHVQLSPTVKDSPYFLGFLLTLFGLFRILNSPALISMDRTEVIHGVASAILTTVVGLFMRQLLSSRDPTEEAYDTKFRELADEIRKDTVEFHDAQKLFVNLIAEFTKTREEVMSREEKVFTEYVEHLKAGATVLSTIHREYPQKVETLLNGIDESAGKLKERLEQVESRFSLAATSYVEQFDQERKALTEASRDFTSQLSTLRSALSDAMATFEQHVDGFGGLAASYSQAGTDLTNSVAGFAQEIRTGHANLTGLANNLSKFRDLADEIRKDTVEFHDAQRLFVNLITEFTKTREEVMSREEKVFTEYVEHLKAGATVLSTIASRDFTSQLSTLRSALSDAMATFEQHVDGFGGLAASYSQAGTDLTNSVAGFAQEIRTAHANLTGSLSDLKVAFVDIKGIDSIIDDLIRLLNKKLAALENGV